MHVASSSTMTNPISARWHQSHQLIRCDVGSSAHRCTPPAPFVYRRLNQVRTSATAAAAAIGRDTKDTYASHCTASLPRPPLSRRCAQHLRRATNPDAPNINAPGTNETNTPESDLRRSEASTPESDLRRNEASTPESDLRRNETNSPESNLRRNEAEETLSRLTGSTPEEQRVSALIAALSELDQPGLEEDDGDETLEDGVVDDEEEDDDDYADLLEEQRRSGSAQINLEDEDIERVFLIGVMLKRDKRNNTFTVDESLEELGRLADTAGLKVVGSSYQVLEAPFTSTYIGSGKVQEIATAVRSLGVDTVIFDDELSPVQLRNLEKVFGKDNDVRVCDRTSLILDIFSQRAQTKEGKLQVELAATEYQLPRVTRLWSHLERQSGGGQVKGMGEKQKEVDKRLLKNRMADLRRELEEVRRHRAQYRSRRQATPVPVAAMVGYTNAGKSTLLNTMTGAGVLAEDKLFATLDPTTRRIRLKGNQEVLLSDTVGFIQKLPTTLVAAFRATLEEVQAATLLLHVLDVSHPNAKGQADAVMQVLHELKTTDLPIITVWNKIDQHPNPEELREQAAILERTVCISGLTGEGLEELQDMISSCLEESMIEMDIMLPYASGELLDSMHKMGQVKSCEYTPHGTLINACVPKALAGRLQEFSILPPREETEDQPWLQPQPPSVTKA